MSFLLSQSVISYWAYNKKSCQDLVTFKGFHVHILVKHETARMKLKNKSTIRKDFIEKKRSCVYM